MKEIKLTKGFMALVDDEDYDKLVNYSWYISKTHGKFYARAFNKNHHGKLSMHRFIMNAPDGMQVDHINHNGLDNRKENLRIVTHRENHHNRIRKNKTGFIGVRQNGLKYESRIRINGKIKHLGTFNTALEAHNVYMKKMVEIDFKLPTPYKEDKPELRDIINLVDKLSARVDEIYKDKQEGGEG